MTTNNTATDSTAKDAPMLVLVVGPYRSGTGNDPAKMAANLHRMEAAAAPIFEAGHVPIVADWISLPILRDAGISSSSPEAADVLYPMSDRLLHHATAVLRVPGASAGADNEVAIAQQLGLPVYWDVSEIPSITSKRA